MRRPCPTRRTRARTLARTRKHKPRCCHPHSLPPTRAEAVRGSTIRALFLPALAERPHTAGAFRRRAGVFGLPLRVGSPRPASFAPLRRGPRTSVRWRAAGSSSLRFVLHACCSLCLTLRRLPASCPWGKSKSTAESQSQRRLRRAPASNREGSRCRAGVFVGGGVGSVGVCPRRALFERTRNLMGVQAAGGFRGWWGWSAPLAPPSEPWFGGPARRGQTPTSGGTCGRCARPGLARRAHFTRSG
jgi:hypothetical protein